MSERVTEWLFLKEAGIELGKNAFGDVFAQGKTTGHDDLIKLFKQMGGKPDISELDDCATTNTGMAMPEYVVTFNDNKKTIMVVECKASEIYHKSSDNVNRPKAYAVDGVLWYAKHLKNDYNVIAVAISGKVADKCRVGAYYWAKNMDSPSELKKSRDVILDPLNYLNMIEGKKLQRKFSIEQVRELSLEMHDKLREIKVSVKDKPIFIAGILIALQDASFRKDWDSVSQFGSLVNMMTDAIETMLRDSDIRKGKVDAIKTSFGKIKANEKLKSMPLGISGSLSWFIGQLESKILPMMNHYEYTEDALGIFYHEFIKYSSGDGNGLGIVLTPKHLTDFMCELGDINANSKVIDICCGSGSFLVTAMSKMCKHASPKKIDEIKKTSLYGIELDIELFTLAVTNMIIRQDGKSNIVHGDCFDQGTIKEFIKPELQLNLGLINPPYSQTDHSELEFVERLLSILTPNGLGVAVVPMSCAIGTKFKETRRRIFKNHTLKAVFSMPDDIFYPTGTNVCVMVWQAYKPHDSTQKTFFGFCKDDGFVKRKKLGRIDYKNLWNDIRSEWLELYRDKRVVDGKSALQAVAHSDEWLAEAYMKTDYSKLTQNDFEQTVRDYLAYLIKSGDINYMRSLDISLPKTNIANTHLQDLDIAKWGEYRVGDIFDIYGRGELKSLGDLERGTTPVVSTSEYDNGVIGLYNVEPKYCNAITVSFNGSCGFFAYHPYAFNANGDVGILKPKFALSKPKAMFLITILGKMSYKYKYGRKLNANRLFGEIVKLPIGRDGQVDWGFMEQYIGSMPFADII